MRLITGRDEMLSELDSRLMSQLTLHRGLHTLAGPLLAILRDKLLQEKLQAEVANSPPSLEVAHALEAIDRWCELAEKIQLEPRSW